MRTAPRVYHLPRFVPVNLSGLRVHNRFGEPDTRVASRLRPAYRAPRFDRREAHGSQRRRVWVPAAGRGRGRVSDYGTGFVRNLSLGSNETGDPQFPGIPCCLANCKKITRRIRSWFLVTAARTAFTRAGDDHFGNVSCGQKPACVLAERAG